MNDKTAYLKQAATYQGNDIRQRPWDIERIALLEAMGWVVIRVSAEMLTRPYVIIDRVRTKLRAARCRI
jgi:very-short-patch-repair endonuclease